MTVIAALLAGFVLDCFVGDPQSLPHPVRLMGLVISRGERLLRRLSCKTPGSRFACGALLTVFLAAVSFAVPFLILFALGRAGFYFSFAVQCVMCCSLIAAKSLKKESMRVYEELSGGDLAGAREKLSRIVGRDTENLDKERVARAAVETVAENTGDGVTAPMFYMLIGGASLGFFYKAANTLDSMIGYKNERYLEFGKFAARLDDALNFIPARLTGLLMAVASALCGLDCKGAARIFFRDRKKHASPNSACTEAACAGALGVELAGDASYFGKVVKKPAIGDARRPIEPEDIRRANALMYLTSLLFLVLGCGVRILIISLIKG